MPELQGRFPIRVELQDLTKDDFVRILREPQNSLTKQTVGAAGDRGRGGRRSPTTPIDAMAQIAYDVNRRTQNIGARRLYTILEQVFETISFDAPDLAEKKRHDRRRLRARAAERDREGRGPEQVHPVMTCFMARRRRCA